MSSLSDPRLPTCKSFPTCTTWYVITHTSYLVCHDQEHQEVPKGELNGKSKRDGRPPPGLKGQRIHCTAALALKEVRLRSVGGSK